MTLVRQYRPGTVTDRKTHMPIGEMPYAAAHHKARYAGKR
ncbi:hypothetical protein BLJAPNOD_03740 [Ensifer sp. M14]|jgi:hypothetical protein|nr:hypothetical protein BLJAPNOD_03740 [Ensifer sp. M14]